MLLDIFTINYYVMHLACFRHTSSPSNERNENKEKGRREIDVQLETDRNRLMLICILLHTGTLIFEDKASCTRYHVEIAQNTELLSLCMFIYPRLRLIQDIFVSLCIERPWLFSDCLLDLLGLLATTEVFR